MRLIGLAVLFTLSLLVAPSAVVAQHKAMPVIGYLHFGSPVPFAYQVPAFRQGLSDIGYVEGQNVAIEYRWAEGMIDRLPALAADLVSRQMSPLDGVAGEKQVVNVKELAGSWRGWVTGEQGDERATMIVSADGSYKASTIRGSTAEGKFCLQDGKLRYRSSRTTGTATLSEDKGKTTLTVMPEDPNYRTGRAEYERVK